MADNTEFVQTVIQGWSDACDAVRKAGGTQITLPATDLAVILNVALGGES